DHVLELFIGHLAVTNSDSRLRHEAVYQLGDREDSLDSIVNKEDLAAALKLELDRRADYWFRELHDMSLNRESVPRRCLDHRHIAKTCKRHVQRPGDGCRGHRDHIHLLAHLFYAFLVRDTEALLFVHDQQSEVLEPDVFGQQPVSADYDVDAA